MRTRVQQCAKVLIMVNNPFLGVITPNKYLWNLQVKHRIKRVNTFERILKMWAKYKKMFKLQFYIIITSLGAAWILFAWTWIHFISFETTCKQYNLNAFAAFIHFEDTSAFKKKNNIIMKLYCSNESIYLMKLLTQLSLISFSIAIKCYCNWIELLLCVHTTTRIKSWIVKNVCKKITS